MNIFETMFPSLKGKWAKVDLNKEAEGIVTRVFNPLLLNSVQANFVNEIAKAHGADYTYGGYLEDRSTLWSGHYHNPEEMIHLGADFNVPAGTEVCLPFGGDVVGIHVDPDQNGGWGGRLDFRCRTHPFYFIIGHLDPESILMSTWRGWYPSSHSIGLVGESDKNGGWFPHVHLQCVSYDEYESYREPMSIDGYGRHMNDLSVRFPDPLQTFIEYEAYLEKILSQ